MKLHIELRSDPKKVLDPCPEFESRVSPGPMHVCNLSSAAEICTEQAQNKKSNSKRPRRKRKITTTRTFDQVEGG